jgi:hypothetical protein
MVTKRTPIARAVKSKISPAAIDAFRKMQKLELQCTCPPIDWAGKHWERPGRPCRACKERSNAHHLLWKELRLPPHHWPAFEYPDAECPYPEGCAAAKHWQRDRDEHPEKFELYYALKEAAD